LGATAYVVPAGAGVVAALNPLRLKGAGGDFLRLAALDTLPSDGTPRKFPVVAQRVDAWTKSVEPIGAVLLRRTADNQVEALQVECPHAGCTIEVKEVADEQTGVKGPKLVCPCHKALFDLAGKRQQATSPSPRDLDPLAVEIRNGNEVWVQFQNFKLGTPDRVAVT
jgi:nitrite reductase/ring-hydroxylating ferredoxin subunit